MQKTYPRIVIAGLRGGSGKTTLSLGLIASLAGQGREVIPFKKGPDYIDAGWLSSAAGRPCYNLDPFLTGSRKILDSFVEHAGEADLSVIEGNRGLYDGMDAEGTYSTAELAKLLRAPVILIMDCTKVTRTAAAMVYGMLKFDPKVSIRGVVLNQIAGRRHETVIREAIEKYCGIPVVGAIPKLRGGQLSERHMGLTPFQEHADVSAAISGVSELVRRHVDVNRIYEIAKQAKPLKGAEKESQGSKQSAFSRVVISASETRRESFRGSHSGKKDSGQAGMTAKKRSVALDQDSTGEEVTIGIVRDSAFQFYYPENFDELERAGAHLVEINSLTQTKLPEVDALYIGGGFPETNAIGLSKNRSFRHSLKKAVEGGLPVYAECGGLMYLGRTLVLDGRTYPMSGVLPLDFELCRKPQAHGYTIVTVVKRNPFYPKGTVLKGHEFHYSSVSGFTRQPGAGFAFSMQRGEGILGKKDGICYRNVLATYTHLHAYGSPQWAAGMIRAALLYRKERK